MEYKLIFTDITTLRPYIFAVGGALWGCIVAWLLINYVSDDLLLLTSLFLYLGATYVLILLVRIFYNQTVVIEYRHVLKIPRKGSIVVPCIALHCLFAFIWHLLLSLSVA